MCGIAACTGHPEAPHATERVLQSLEALSYRGYDSAGVGLTTPNGLTIVRAVGEIANLRETIALGGYEQIAADSSATIGHTRWATNGIVDEANAHPHTDASGKIAVVLNGVVENNDYLRASLAERGILFNSQNDTETIAHLLSLYFAESGDPEEALISTAGDLDGAYAIVAAFAAHPGKLLALRYQSPLVVGVGKNEHYIASDDDPLLPHTRRFVDIEDDELAILTPDGHSIRSLHTGNHRPRRARVVSEDIETADKGEYAHFMLKEIFETPDTVRRTLGSRLRHGKDKVRLGGLERIEERLRACDHIMFVASGTSYHAGLVGKSVIEEVAGRPVSVELASELKDRRIILPGETAAFAISQSGGTADTRDSLKRLMEEGALGLGIVNKPRSQIVEMSEGGMLCHAGPEVAVASTKAFVAQVTAMNLLALKLAELHQVESPLCEPLIEELEALPSKLEAVLSQAASIKAMAKKYAGHTDFAFIGKGPNYPAALEGALKLKEITYLNATGYAAGELKHGPLAVVDEDFLTIAINPQGRNYDKISANIQEITARHGPILAVATEGDEAIKAHAQDVIYIPDAMEQVQPILSAVALQLFAYYVALEKGMNIDRPRNLAKCVTVV